MFCLLSTLSPCQKENSLPSPLCALPPLPSLPPLMSPLPRYELQLTQRRHWEPDESAAGLEVWCSAVGLTSG